MARRLVTSIFGFVFLAAVFSVGHAAQPPPTGTRAKPQVVAVSTPPIRSVDGKTNFDAYCAVCHGKDARGHGPAAPAMKVAVPDLTSIAARHGGTFESPAILYVVQGVGKTATPAHGVEEMPIWGEVFKAGDTAIATIRMNNLVTYIKELQQPATATLR